MQHSWIFYFYYLFAQQLLIILQNNFTTQINYTQHLIITTINNVEKAFCLIY